jgi:membrane-associated protease RseP (regulator of RpoE activity)
LDPVRNDSSLLEPPLALTWEPRPKFQDRKWLHAVLLLLTVATTTVVGGQHYLDFRSDFLSNRVSVSTAVFLMRGLLYSVTVLAILGTHEFGHYLACRYYDVDASLPYFLPFPPFLPLGTLTGTLGAVIRIREPMRNKRVLFDVGVAGPIAGFLVALPR